MKHTLFLACLFLCLWTEYSWAQTVPFESEVNQISQKLKREGYQVSSTLFTGSSTIRMWTSVQEDFPDNPIINTGFGGSTAADLKRHLYPLVLQFRPSRVFIYEGDNDINANIPTEDILADLDQIVLRIQVVDPHCEVYLIEAKPSPSRWEKKDKYLALNKEIQAYCEKKEGVYFVETWNPLTDSDGNARPELYLSDMLHLNAEGYSIWKSIFLEYFEEKD